MTGVKRTIAHPSRVQRFWRRLALSVWLGDGTGVCGGALQQLARGPTLALAL
jgi:hypothetical protein